MSWATPWLVGGADWVVLFVTWGSSGCGVQRRAWREMSAVLMVSAGDHWSFRMSCDGPKRWCGLPTKSQGFVSDPPLWGGSRGQPRHGTARTRQMAPVEEEMLGCQILVLNFILGGSNGYEAGMLMSILNTPPVRIHTHRILS